MVVVITVITTTIHMYRPKSLSGYSVSLFHLKCIANSYRINATLYSEKANPPILHLEGNSYEFFTQDDTGTGIAYKGLVVYDLAIASLTKLPILVHDSLILKQISDEAVENILVRYMESGKQVIISLDKQDSYSKRTAEILEKQCVLHLAPNGRELFGRAWSRQET